MIPVADMLAFERQRFRFAGAKEQAIRDVFGLPATRYYQLLAAAIQTVEALEVGPVTTYRLRRQAGRRGARRAATG